MFASRTNWPLEPNLFARALEAHRRSGKPLLDLTASNPTTCGFSYPEKQILAALADPGALTYRPESKGLPEARAAIAAYYRGRPGFAVTPTAQNPGDPPAAQQLHALPTAPYACVDPEHIFLTASTSEAYTYIFRLLCEPGDEILIPAPSYPLFEFLGALADIRLIPYPLVYDHGWQMDLSALRSALSPRSRAVLVVHPNNPTGSFVNPREVGELAAICANREMAIVADEVFLDYASTPEVPSTFALEQEVLTFTLSGLSKICALPQMKLAWLVVSGPDVIAQQAIARLEIIADTYLSPGAPVQLAASKFLGLSGMLREQIAARVATNLAHLDSALGSASPINRLAREGGWYAVLRVPVSRTDESLAVDLLQRHSLLLHPGHFFNFPRDGYLVASLITPEATFQEGIARLQKFFEADR